MARTSVKSTYSLDVGTVRALERMAKRWKVSKSEALRRAILIAERHAEPVGPVDALDRLQRSAGLTAARARDWLRSSRSERTASSDRRDHRSG